MGNPIAEALVRNRMKQRLSEASSIELHNYRLKIEKILNHRLGAYETGVVVEDMEILGETTNTITFRVDYSVDVRIPTMEDEDGSMRYEDNQDCRTQTMTFEKRELNESMKKRVNESQKFSMTINDTEKQIQGLLEVIESYTKMGHSFSLVVDPGDSNYEKKFYIDGDGSDRISDITIEGEEESVEESKSLDEDDEAQMIKRLSDEDLRYEIANIRDKLSAAEEYGRESAIKRFSDDLDKYEKELKSRGL